MGDSDRSLPSFAEDELLARSHSMTRPHLSEEIAAVRALCRGLALGEVTPAFLKAAHHTTLLLSPLAIVARVQSAEPIDAALDRAVREVAVARHLASRGAPALAPMERLSGPHLAASSVVTLWLYWPHERTADEGDLALAAATLASIHHALLDFGGGLPPYMRALDRCWTVLADGEALAALGAQDRDLLRTQFRRLRSEVDIGPDFWVPLHGDVHLGNLLLGEGTACWTDFEDACLGPREYDIANLPAAAWARFDGIDRALVRRFADLRSVCVAVWCWADLARSAEVREAAEYHLLRVRHLSDRP